MQTSAVDPVASQLSTESEPASAAVDDLGRNDFLRLLVAQLENQDPLAPQKNEEFVAQLATFSSLEQLIDANGSLQTIADVQGGLAGAIDLLAGASSGSDRLAADAIDLIGREVRVAHDGRFSVLDGEAEDVEYRLESSAAEVKIRVFAADGSLVRAGVIEGVAGGSHGIDFSDLPAPAEDGLAHLNQVGGGAGPLADGFYRVEVEAQSANGNPVGARFERWLPVSAVNFVGEEVTLVAGGDEIEFESLLGIRAARAEDI